MTTISTIPSGNITTDDFAFPPAVRERYTEAWSCPSFGEYVTRHAAAKPGASALADDSHTVTWQQLETLVQGCMRSLTACGVRKGDVVVVQGDNSVQMAVMMLSAMELGAVLGPMQDRATASELEFVLTATGARYCFSADSGASPEQREAFRHLADRVGALSRVARVALPSVAEGLRFDWLKEAEGSEPSHSDEPTVRISDPIRVMYTSGSTGAPKGVLHSFGSTVSACEVSVRIHRWEADSVGWVVVPIALNWGKFQLFSGIISGATIHLRRRHDGDELLSAIASGEITHVGLPPTGYISLLEKVEQSPSTGTRLGRLRTMVSAGAPCGLSLLQDIHDVFGVHVSEAYGMTEAGWVAASEGIGSERSFGADVGRPTPGTLVRIIDPHTSAEVPAGQVGSVEISGPSLFAGYYNNPKENAAALTDDGWFRTGDLGYLSNDGSIVLTGREKDVIKHGGHLVTPLELEETIYRMGGHREAAVLGLPDPYYGEKIVAVFERSDQEPPTLAEITAYLDGKLAKFKWPQEVHVVDELPRTPTGKVKKNVLAEELKSLQAPAPQNER